MRQETLHSIDTYLNVVQDVVARVSREAIRMMTLRLYQAWEQRRRVFVIGNGGSASTASHVSNDLSKATVVPGAHRMRVISLTDNVALISAWANDVSFEAIFEQQLENLLDAGDTVIGISASGNSPNVLRAMSFARERGAVTIGWTGLTGGRLRAAVDLCVHVPSEDVGVIESVHLVIAHILAAELTRRIASSTRVLELDGSLVRDHVS